MKSLSTSLLCGLPTVEVTNSAGLVNEDAQDTNTQTEISIESKLNRTTLNPRTIGLIKKLIANFHCDDSQRSYQH